MTCELRVSIDRKSVDRLQQSIVFVLLVLTEGNAMDELLLFGKLEVDELHVLLSSKTEILHERLEQRFGLAITRSQSSCNLRVENLRLFDASSDVEEFDERMQVLYGVDATGC